MNYDYIASTGKQNTLVTSSNLGVKFFNTCHMFLAILVVFWLNTGISTYINIPGVINYGLYAVWFSIALFSSKHYISKLIMHGWPLFVFYIYLILLSFFTSENYISTYISNFTYLIIIFSIFIYYFNQKHHKFRKVIVSILFIDCIYIAINTYIHLKDNPMLARYLSAASEITEQLLGSFNFVGIGGYGYFYSLVAIILYLGYLFFNFRSKRFLLSLLIITLMTVLIKASFTISILFVFGFLGLILLLKFPKRIRFILLFPLSLIILFVSQGGLKWLFLKLSNIGFLSDEVSIRLIELAYFTAGTQASDTDLSGRFYRYSQSIEAFFHNFIAGVSANPISNHYVGGHSAWLDLMGHFGLFSFLMFIFFFKMYKYCIKNTPTNFKVFVNVYWLYFVCLGFINTLFFANIFTTWLLFIPFAILVFSNKNKQHSGKVKGKKAY